MTVAVVGDGAVGLLGVLAAARMGAARVIAMSRHEQRQKLAGEYGATEIVAERGDAGVAMVKEMTDGVGADATLECVGTAEAMTQALRSTRPGGTVGFVGVPHGVSIAGEDLFRSHVGVRGGPAPVRRFLPELVDLVWRREIDPGRVFDLDAPAGPRWPRATGRWTSARRSRRCCVRSPAGSVPSPGPRVGNVRRRARATEETS